MKLLSHKTLVLTAFIAFCLNNGGYAQSNNAKSDELKNCSLVDNSDSKSQYSKRTDVVNFTRSDDSKATIPTSSSSNGSADSKIEATEKGGKVKLGTRRIGRSSTPPEKEDDRSRKIRAVETVTPARKNDDSRLRVKSRSDSK